MRVPAHFERFHSTIRLNPSRSSRIDASHMAMRSLLEADPSVGPHLVGTFLHGSYASATEVQPLSGEFGADAVLVLRRSSFSTDGHLRSPSWVLSWLGERLAEATEYRDRLTVDDRCVCLEFTGDFHLDLVPALQSRAGPLLVGDDRQQDWRPMNPHRLVAWCRAQDERTDGMYGHVVRMLKRWRDHRGVCVPSVTLAVMLGNYLPDMASYGDDDASWLIEAFDCLHKRFFLRLCKPEICNPCLPAEDLARSWKKLEFYRFAEAVALMRDATRDALYSSEEWTSARSWREILGEDFPLRVAA